MTQQAHLSLNLSAGKRLEVLHVPPGIFLVVPDVVNQVRDHHGEPEEHGDQHGHICGPPQGQTQVPVLSQQDERHPNGSCWWSDRGQTWCVRSCRYYDSSISNLSVLAQLVKHDHHLHSQHNPVTDNTEVKVILLRLRSLHAS